MMPRYPRRMIYFCKYVTKPKVFACILFKNKLGLTRAYSPLFFPNISFNHMSQEIEYS